MKFTKKFIGQILNRNDTLYTIKFLRRREEEDLYFWPEQEDIDHEVEYNMILGTLKEPNFLRRGMLRFKEQI